jgi:hypothetical protein
MEPNVRSIRLPSRTGAFLAVFGAVLSAAVLAGCNALDRLLDVELPGQVEVGAAEVPAKAATLVNGGVTLFNCALTWHILRGGTLGDELAGGPGGNTTGDDRSSFLEYVVRGTEAPNCNGHYSSVAEARWMNDHVLVLLEGWSDAEVANRSLLIARAAAYAGYSNLLLGEGFCSGAVDGGPEIDSAEIVARAEARFGRAIEAATAAGNAELLNLARVGRARARLFLDQLPDARADAELVPAGFIKQAQYPATATRVNENGLSLTATGVYMGEIDYTVDALYRDVRFAGVPDPRVGVVNAGKTNRYGLPLWVPTKYPTNTSPIRLASWEEAQLIVAEAMVAAGDLSGAVEIINALHAKVGLPGFASTDPTEVRQQIIYERRAEFFLEGQHLADYRRLQLPFVPPPGTSYYGVPGLTFGVGRCFPFPISERANNPNTH